ncbi:hypothetical protein ABMA46_07315 [Mesorhizobium sp. CN5-321]|uniref:hypothetical protein n=1 Tax=Mesorhizobium hunchu TaxID=3157708 RepID=UPI0032B70C95
MNTILAILVASAAMIGVAHADQKMDAYSVCWAAKSTAYLNQAEKLNGSGLEDIDLKDAANSADGLCVSQYLSAVDADGQAKVDEMRQYMEVQLYGANPLQETASIQPATNPSIVYAKGYTVACAWFDDIKKHRHLIEAGRPDLAINLDCMSVDPGQKLVVLDTVGDDLTEVLYEAKGFQRELWISTYDVRH